jgi:succinoglycan biosynthesis transport protein ExoP
MSVPAQTETPNLGLGHYLGVVRRRKWIMLVVFVATTGSAALLSLSQEPKYRAETKIVIGQGRGLFSPTLANAFQPFSATMSDLLESHVVARGVIDRLGLDMSEESLLAKTDVAIRPESSTLTVSVVDEDAELARRIADTLGRVFSDLVEDRFGASEQPQAQQDPLPPLTASIWDPAHIDPIQVSPKPRRTAAIAAVLGVLLGLLLGFLRDHFDRSLRTREEVEAIFGVPVIGQIPRRATARRRREIIAPADAAGSVEAYRKLRANLRYLAVGREVKTLLVTSSAPGDGKTTLAANLSVAIAESGAETLLIEADLRRPRLQGVFGGVGGPGLTSLLIDRTTVGQAVHDISPVVSGNGRDSGARLSFLPTGPLPPNPSELLASAKMRDLLNKFSQKFDYIVLDSPPILVVADALELARHVDGMLIVSRAGRTTVEEAREVRELVDRMDIPLLGIVLTDAPALASDYYSAQYVSRQQEKPPPVKSVARRT